MADQQLLLQALSDFAHTLVQRYAVTDVLFRLTDHVTEVLDVAGAGVSLGDDGKLRFVTASSEAITEIERVQELAQQGACVEAFSTGAVVKSPDLTTETRWPQLVPDALRLGFCSMVALPMRFGDTDTIGSLNIYDTRRREWREDDLQAALVLADMAVSYVTNASELERSERVREQLQCALESRIVIEQAKGMLAAERGISVDDAFTLMRQHARSRNASLQDVAGAIVNLGLRV